MSLAKELEDRGFIHQHTSENLGEVVDGEKRTVYHGIDPTADSAHAGNMVIWILLRHLAINGHKIIFLVGGGTGMIGDPKPDAERTLQSAEQINNQVEKIKTQAQRLIGSGDSEVEFVNNYDWLIQQNLITFLRDIGKHFTVNELIKKEAIAKRLEGDTGISYTEFAYPLLQAFDYLTLNKKYGCDLQIGGSDQWGNIISGVDLIRRKEKKVVHAITVPLVVDKSTGKKFGKSEGNAVWLDGEKTPPYKFYQFWINISDESVISYLKLFTFLPLDEISTIEQEFTMSPGGRVAQKRLAEQVTAFVHGEEATKSAQNVSEILFGNGALTDLTKEEKTTLLDNAPTQAVVIGQSIIEILVESGLASSNREARTFIESGAVLLDGKKIENVDVLIEETMFNEQIAVLKRGKKQMTVLVLK